MSVKLENIKLEFDGTMILDDLSLEFSSGNLSCLLGKSGSGKTSILKIIAGISPPFSGRVLYNETVITDLPTRSRNIGWVPQQQLIFPDLDVFGNIAFGLIARDIAREQRIIRVEEMLELVGLEGFSKRDPSGLSGGERQRVALARALAPDPDILLLDEPFSSLDAPERDRLALAFRKIQLDTGVTTIHVTHSPQEAELISDYTMILANGKIIQQDQFHKLINSPQSPEVANILNLSNVVQPGDLPNIDNPALIPYNAFNLGSGDFEGRVIAKTGNRIHLQVGKIRLEVEKNKFVTKIGEKIKFDIKWDALHFFDS